MKRRRNPTSMSPATYANTEAADEIIAQCGDTLANLVRKVSKKEPSGNAKRLIAASTTIIGKHLQARLDKAAIENEKILAESYEKIALANKANAEAHKTDAEAEAIEIANAEKKIAVVERAIAAARQMKSLGSRAANPIVIEAKEQPRGLEERTDERTEKSSH